MAARLRFLAIALAGLGASLLALGAVSHTLIRYVIQAAPALLALFAVTRGYTWSSSASIPIFSFWMFMVINAAFVIGYRPIVGRPVSPLEYPLMVLIAIFSLSGLVASVGIVRGPGRGPRLLAAALWFLLQCGAMALSIWAGMMQ